VVSPLVVPTVETLARDLLQCRRRENPHNADNRQPWSTTDSHGNRHTDIHITGHAPAGGRNVTIDKSLKRKGRLARARSVLKRDERIAVLESEERWQSGRSPLGLPKVRIAKTALAKKKKKKAKEEADTTAAAEATPDAAGSKASAPAAKTAGAAKPASPAKPAPGKK
jgi:small basic protein (TIGR04137 family)